MSTTEQTLYLKSFSGDKWYRVSPTARTCDCAAFRAMPGPPCKHLKAIGIHNEWRPFVPTARPTFSQALSGLVKSLRLRRPDDAVYWLVYLDTFREPTSRMRVARRLLIGSAEDGHSVEVIENVARNWRHLARVKTDILHLAAEALRICKMPNWWHPDSGGKDYIYSGLLAERKLFHYRGHHTFENMACLIEKGVAEKDRSLAIAGVLGLSHARLSATRQAEFVAEIAAKTGHRIALRLTKVHLQAKWALSSDNNFLSQAAWVMAGGESPIAEQSKDVFATEVFELVERARERWRTPEPIPGWCCDGTHSAGDDPRFMGVWFHMYAACLAFERYGRVNPEDNWIPEFYCYDGLEISAEPPVSTSNASVVPTLAAG